ncbi:N-acetylmuramoyl-L-alanine amidase [Microbacteriaceae bacterium K1510]|nr:N-acetylmuramoyl-L-alanine amidase [Microbacteriaceae bacterium K1510]
MTFRTLSIAAVLAVGLGAGLLTASAARAAEGVDSRALAAPGTSQETPVATDVRVGGDDKQTRFILDLSQKIDLAAFTLADPYRVVIDIPQTTFKLPAKAGDQGRGLVKAFRYGLIMQGGSRIVLDVKGPVRIDKAFTLEATDGQPARLVLDLAATDRDSFLRTIALANKPARPVARSNEPPAKDDDPRPLIVLDPGHGGIDTGTKGLNGENEKDIVLAFAQTLSDKLTASNKYRVVLTRDDDTFIPLNERVRFARQRGAALFISVHADSLPKREGQAEGATVYTLSEHASDAEAGRLAEAENRADVIAGVDLTAEPDDVANILVDLAQRETKTFSLQFARSAVSELKSTARLHKQPLKSAGFVVLRAPDVPSVLVELGYMSTKDDLKQLTSPVWRDKTADALAQAVDTFFGPRIAAGANGRGR